MANKHARVLVLYVVFCGLPGCGFVEQQLWFSFLSATALTMNYVQHIKFSAQIV